MNNSDLPENVVDLRGERAVRVLDRLLRWLDGVELDADGRAALDRSCPVCMKSEMPGLLCGFHEAESFLKREGKL